MSSSLATLVTQLSLEEASNAHQFAILAEYDCQTVETFLTFIQYQGNEDALAQLADYIDMARMRIPPRDVSTFFLDLETLVSDRTATEMAATHISVRHPPRKLIGTLAIPVLAMEPTDSLVSFARKLYNTIGDTRIVNHIKPAN